MADMFHELEEITSFSENSEDIPSIFQQFDLLVNNRNKSKKKENLVEDLRRPGHNHALDKMMLQHLNKKTKPKRKVSSVPLLYIPGETNSSIVTIDQETFRGLVGNPKPKQRQSRKKVPKTHDFEDSKVPLSQTLPFDSETVLQEVETGQMKGDNSPQNQKVECAICGVKFENSLRLKQHSRVHRRCINNGRRYSPRKTFCLIPENFTNQINNHGDDISNENCNELSTKTIGQCSGDISSSLAMPIASTNGSTCVSINANLVNTFSDPKNGAILSNILQNFVQQNKNNSANSKSDKDKNSQTMPTVLSDKISSETDVGLTVSDHDESVCKSNKGNKNISTIGDFRGCTNSNFSNTVKTKNVQQKTAKSKNSIENLINENKGSESNMVEDRHENVYHILNSNQSVSCIEKSNQSESCVDKRNIIVDKQSNKLGNIQTGLQMRAAMEKSSKSSNLCKNTLTVIAEIHAQAFDNACNQRISGNEVKTFNGELCRGIEISDETEMERESEYISIEELEKGALMALKKLSAQISPRKGSYSLSKQAASPLKGSNLVSSEASPIKGNNSLTAQTSQIIENQIKENNFLFTQTSPIKECNSLSAQASPMKGSNSLAADLEKCQMKKSNSFSAQASPMKGNSSSLVQPSPIKEINCLSAQASPMKGRHSLSAGSSPVTESKTLSIHATQSKRSNFLSVQERPMKGSNLLSNKTPCKRRKLVGHYSRDQSSCDAKQKEISCSVTEKSSNKEENVKIVCNQTETKGSPCTRMVEFVKQIEKICKNKNCPEMNDLEGKQSQKDGDNIISDKNGESSVVRSPPYLDDLSFRNTTKYCGISLNNDRQKEGIETFQNQQDSILNDSFCSRTSSYYDNMKLYKSWKTQSVDLEKLNSTHRNHVCDFEERAVILNHNHESDEVIQNSINNQDAFLSCELNEDGEIAQNSDTPNLPTLVCSELDSEMQENGNNALNFTECSRDKNTNEENTTVTQKFERPLADLCELKNMQENHCNVFENDENCYHTETDIFTDGSMEQSPRMTQIIDPSNKAAFLKYRQLHYEDSILRDETLDHDASLSNFSSTEKSRNQQLFKRFEDEPCLFALQTVNNDLEQITLIDEKGDNFESLQKLKQKKGDNPESTFDEFSKNTQNKSSIAKNLFKNFCKLRNSESDTNCNVYAEIMKLPKNKNQFEDCYDTTSTDDSDESDQGGGLLHRKRIDHKTLLLKCSRLCSYLENMERIKCQKRLLKCSSKDKKCKAQTVSKKLKSKESSVCKSMAIDKNMNKGKSFNARFKDTKNKKGNSHGLIKDHGNLQSQNCRKRKTELHDGSSVEKCRKVCNSKINDMKKDNEEQRKKDGKLSSQKLVEINEKLRICNKKLKEKCTVKNKKNEFEQESHIQTRTSPRKRCMKNLEKTENLTHCKERINCVQSQKKVTQKQSPSKLSETETSDSRLISIRKSPRKSPAKLILTGTGINSPRTIAQQSIGPSKLICLNKDHINSKKGPRKTVTPSKVVCLSKKEISSRKSPRKAISCSQDVCISTDETITSKSPKKTVSPLKVVCLSKEVVSPRKSPRKNVCPSKLVCLSKGKVITRKSPRKKVSQLKATSLHEGKINRSNSPRKTVSPLKVFCLSKDKISPRKSPRKTVSPLKVVCLSKGKISIRKSPRKLTCKINCVMDCCSAGVGGKKVNNTSKSLKKLSFDQNKKEEKQLTATDKNKSKMTTTSEGYTCNRSRQNSGKEIKENEKKGGNNEKTEKDKLKVKLFNNMSGKERMARVTKSKGKKEVKNLCIPTAAKSRKSGDTCTLSERKKTNEIASWDRSKTDFSSRKQKHENDKNEKEEVCTNMSGKKLKISSVKSVQDFPPNEVPCFKTPEKVLDLNGSSKVCVLSAEKMTPKKRWKALFHSQTNENKHIESIVDSKNNQSEANVDQINQSVSSFVKESSQSGTSISAVDKNNQSESNFDKRNQSVSSNVEEIGQSESCISCKSNKSEYSIGAKMNVSESCKDKTFVLNSEKSCKELIDTQNILYSQNIPQNPDSLSFLHSETTEKNNHAELIVFDEGNQTEPCVDIISQSESYVDKSNQLEPCVAKINQPESCDGKRNQLESRLAKVNQSDLSIDQLESGLLTMMPSVEIENTEHSIHESDDECDSDESWLDASFSCARFIQYTQVRNSTRTLPFIEQMRLSNRF